MSEFTERFEQITYNILLYLQQSVTFLTWRINFQIEKKKTRE